MNYRKGVVYFTIILSLQAFMERISKDFLSIFTCTQFLATQLQPLAERTIHRLLLVM